MYGPFLGISETDVPSKMRRHGTENPQFPARSLGQSGHSIGLHLRVFRRNRSCTKLSRGRQHIPEISKQDCRKQSILQLNRGCHPWRCGLTLALARHKLADNRLFVPSEEEFVAWNEGRLKRRHGPFLARPCMSVLGRCKSSADCGPTGRQLGSQVAPWSPRTTMGLYDTPPEHVPQWLPMASTAVLVFGMVSWYTAYALITIQSIKDQSYGMPLIATIANWSWELLYSFTVAEHPFEMVGLGMWFFLDVGLVWTTVKYAPNDWKHTAPWIGRNMALIFAVLVPWALWGNYTFSSWWLSEPGMGFGTKQGKWFRGKEGYDTLELGIWSALIPQGWISAGSLAMLISRGHSGGTSWTIWALRAAGSAGGMFGFTYHSYYYWPEQHGFFANPFHLFLSSIYLIPDIIYPFVLYRVQQTEIILPDGRHMSAHHAKIEQALAMQEVGYQSVLVNGVDGPRFLDRKAQ
ncbi:hypothetical protein MCOR06_010169 [Pyricularia oryzae]|nr:hypothetical protein MCOR06_010169 [Pyricularia oryzae]